MRRALLLGLMVWAGAAWAQARPVRAPAAPEDDDEVSAPVHAPGPRTPQAPTPAPSSAAPAEPTGPSRPTKQFELVSGAPLWNPNVAVHVVEKKTFFDTGRFEVVLFPATVQLNGKFTQHYGTFASLVLHLQENFALQVSGGYNWYNTESDFNGELVDKTRTEAQAATSLLLQAGIVGGVEVAPVYGKFSLFSGVLAHFSVVVTGGAGVGWTRHQLKPVSVTQDGAVSPATFGDTGARFMGEVGLGFRLRLGDHFALRLEVRDDVYTARTDRVNGCNVEDLAAMDARLRSGGDVLTTPVSSQCQADGLNPDHPKFAGTDSTGTKRSNDVPLAYNLVKVPSSDVINNLGLFVGLSFIF